MQFGIWNPTSDWNPDWNQIPRNRNPRRGIHAVESRIQDCLEFPYASVNSTCAQPPPPPGICAPLSVPGVGHLQMLALPGGRAFANPRANPELLTRTRFPIRIKLQRRFYWKKSRLVHLSRIGINCRGL